MISYNMDENNTLKIFTAYQKYMEDFEGDRERIKSSVREIEIPLRHLSSVLLGVHKNADPQSIKKTCEEVNKLLQQFIECEVRNLSCLVPLGQYFRFHDLFRHSIQRIVFVVALLHYFENETLINREETAKLLNLDLSWEDGFYLNLDDYLLGILQLTNELSRLCVNLVIAGDYERPLRIARFISELDAAFRLLNLKNDSLRKKFDGLKYDLKKCEEVVYDLSIRGLKTLASKK